MQGKVVNRTPTVAKLSTYIVQTTRQSVRARRRCAQDVRHVYQQAACMQCTRCSLECIVVVISATEVCTGQCRYSVHLSFCCIHPIRSLSNHAAFHPSIHPSGHPSYCTAACGGQVQFTASTFIMLRRPLFHLSYSLSIARPLHNVCLHGVLLRQFAFPCFLRIFV